MEDTRQDLRWPEFCAEAARLNVRSMLCVPLWIDERSLGALSLYADQAAAFNDLHERVTILLATSQRSPSPKRSALTRCTTHSATGTLSGRPRAS